MFLWDMFFIDRKSIPQSGGKQGLGMGGNRKQVKKIMAQCQMDMFG
jgi:hypothetical protein